MRIVGVIPARYKSSRFEGKPLADILGKTMVQHVFERARRASCLGDVVVATDDERIRSEVERFGGKAVMTSMDHQSGTDRVAEAIRDIDADVIINIQGDEPMLDPVMIDEVAAPFRHAAQSGVVAFAGWVAGSLFISIDHPDGVRTTYSWLSAVAVRRGDPVTVGQVVGSTGHGHPDVATPHLHFGARVGSTYIDPMLLLERGSVVGLIHLAPLDGSGGGARPPPRRAPTMAGLWRASVG